jgi:hypothetical protein
MWWLLPIHHNRQCSLQVGSYPMNLRIIRGGKNAPAHLCQGATLHNNGSDGVAPSCDITT